MMVYIINDNNKTESLPVSVIVTWWNWTYSTEFFKAIICFWRSIMEPFLIIAGILEIIRN